MDRVFGDVTKKWKESGDLDDLHRAINEIVSKKINIKHCLENLPDEMNHALLEASVKYKYKHVVLYREQAADRLLSLHYAMASSVWRKDQKATVEINDEFFNEPIDVEKCISHEKMCRRKMASVYERLLQLKAEPLTISFEALYSQPFDYASILVRNLYARLGLSTQFLTDGKLKKLFKNGGQGSKRDYKKFARSEDLITEAGHLPVLTLQRMPVFSPALITDVPGLQLLELWDLLPSIDRNHYIIAGVCYYNGWNMSDCLFLKVAGNKIMTTVGASSPRVGELFQNAGNSRACRFISEPFEACANAELYLEREGQKTHLIATLNLFF